MSCGSRGAGHRCDNCDHEVAIQRAAEKAARLTRRGKNAPEVAGRTGAGKVALRARVVGAGGAGGGGVGTEGGGKGGRGQQPPKVRFSVSSNFRKVRVGGSVSRGHYLYGRGAGGGAGGKGGGKGTPRAGAPTTPRSAPANNTSHCDLIISPRKTCTKSPRPEQGTEQGVGGEGELPREEEQYPPGEDLFIPARSVVTDQHHLQNDDLRFLFKYGVRLPVLSSSTSGRLALAGADPPAPPPTPPPASIDEHYLIHKHFLSQLPDATRLLYDDDTDGIGTLCDAHSGIATAVSEITLPPEKPRDHVIMSTTSIPRDVTNRVMTSYSGTSGSSALSKMASYSWRRAEDDRKLPQVTDDLFYRAAHASPDARASFNRQRAAMQGLQSARYAASRGAMAANCGFCQKARAMSDSDDGSSETSSILSNGAFRTKQLVRRINELEGMRQAATPSTKDLRSPTATSGVVAPRSQLYRRDRRKPSGSDADDILYNQVQQSISWLQVPRDTQSHITILGRSLSPSWGSHGSHSRSHSRSHQAMTKAKDPRSAMTYLEYLENIKDNVKQGGKRSNKSPAKSNSSEPAGHKPQGDMADPVDSVFAVNQPLSRPNTEYEEQVLTTTFTTDSPADDEDEPFLVNGVLLENRPPPPNSPKHPNDDDITQRHYTGKRSTLRVDLRNATRVI